MKPKCIPKDTWMVSKSSPKWGKTYLECVRELRRLMSKGEDPKNMFSPAAGWASVADSKREEAIEARIIRNFDDDVRKHVWQGGWRIIQAAKIELRVTAVVSSRSVGYSVYYNDYRREAIFSDGTRIEWGQTDERSGIAANLFGRGNSRIVIQRP